MTQRPRKHGEHSWPKDVLRKLFNISPSDSDYSADEGDDAEPDHEEICGWEDELFDKERKVSGLQDKFAESIPYRLRRRNSETLRAQYINSKELRICVGTWNVAGKVPPDDLYLEEWLDMDEPADIYVLGLQEMVPLNAGNLFGPEDSRSVPKWEYLIRETLNRIQPVKANYKCYSDPPSPSRIKSPDDLHETDSDDDDKVHPLDGEGSVSFHLDSDGYAANLDDSEGSAGSSNTSIDAAIPQELDLQKQSPMKRLDRSHRLRLTNYVADSDISIPPQIKLARTLSSSEKIGLVWPEKPLALLAKCTSDRPNSFKLVNSKSIKSVRACKLVKSVHEDCDPSEISLISDFNLEVILCKKKRPPFVRIISKQMIGIFLSIWVRRSLRKNIHNLKVSTVGVGGMGYIGNKGSISISMSIHQTLLCFVCSHLASGEKCGDELRRNTDVQEIHRRTHFSTVQSNGLPRTIHDHDRIFWLGDLNYRINLPYERTHKLILKKKWSELAERDQLKRELKKGRAFDGWSEGVLNFPPTYKYDFNSGKYNGEDLKPGRTPAWCDRILSFGKGIKLFRYKRSELRLSDHRPVTAIFTAEIEEFCHRKLQRALALTNAEVDVLERTGGTFDQIMDGSLRRIDTEYKHNLQENRSQHKQHENQNTKQQNNLYREEIDFKWKLLREKIDE